ncbi:multiheme c-type cytochrome [Leptonema illini]|uniref:Outer membrane cytochrome MtrC/MtrF-like domain-containing protein n=1 Tax=Leptonema illini DSM 21528 TaxID=929563 RepID=H2CG43_9LEPT|nr:multiheme c-type cytochrome [Leptonema illini]EHQ05724.1 hypothetical protein Lepil_1026 [Leptonema illini DSM 21528]
MPRIPLLIVSTLLLIGPGCITNPPETSDPDPFADNDQAALSAFERIKSRGETLPDSERYRMLFNRPPFDDTASPILSRLSQGRYPVADAGSNPRWQKAESCARCHEKEFGAWKKSLHSQAFTNARFYHAFQLEPMAWCMNCHAPYWYNSGHAAEARPIRPIQEIYQTDKRQYVVHRPHATDRLPSYREDYDYDDLRSPQNEEGVSCAVCHVRNDVVYTGRPVTSEMATKAGADDGHELRHDPILRSPDLCAGCHEFNFPDRVSPFIAYSPHPMQATVSEFLAHRQKGSAPATTCTGCHLRQDAHIASPLSHREAIPHVIQIRFHTRQSLLKMQIRIPRIGHPFPTGDLFRQVRVRAFSDGGRELLDYRIARIVNNATLKIESDTRLLPVNQTIDTELVFPLREAPSRCEVEYLFEGRIEHTLPRAMPDEEKRIVLFSGPCK